MIPTSERSSQQVRRYLAITILLGIVLAGCAVSSRPAPTAGSAVYELNRLDAYDEVSMDEAWNAALQAIDRLGFIVTRRNSGPHKSELIARTQGNRKVAIRMSTQTLPLLHTRIQVDIIGDESLSRLMMHQIRQRYGEIASRQ